MRTTSPGPSCPETETAALGVRSRHGGKDERAFAGTFKHNVIARRGFTSSLKLAPIWTDEHVFAGWLSEAETSALSCGRALP